MSETQAPAAPITGSSLLSKMQAPTKPVYRLIHPVTGQVVTFDDPAQAQQQLAIWQQQAGPVNPQQPLLNELEAKNAELGAQRKAEAENPPPTHNPVNVEPMPQMQQVPLPQKQPMQADPVSLGISALAGIFGGSPGAQAAGNASGNILRNSVDQVNQDYQERVHDYSMRVAAATQQYQQAADARNDRMKWQQVQSDDDYLDRNALFKQRAVLGSLDAQKTGVDTLSTSTGVLGQKQLVQGSLEAQGSRISEGEKNYRADVKSYVDLAKTAGEIDAERAKTENDAKKYALDVEKAQVQKKIEEVKLRISAHEADARIAEAHARVPLIAAQTAEARARTSAAAQQVVESKARTHKINVEANNAQSGGMTPYQRESLDMRAVSKGLIRGPDGSYSVNPNQPMTAQQHERAYTDAYREWNSLYTKYTHVEQQRAAYIGKADVRNANRKGGPLPADYILHDSGFVDLTQMATQLRQQLGDARTRYEALRNGQAQPTPDNWNPTHAITQVRGQYGSPQNQQAIQSAQDLMAGIHHSPQQQHPQQGAGGITIRRIK